MSQNFYRFQYSLKLINPIGWFKLYLIPFG